jgi:ATP synthase protein I
MSDESTTRGTPQSTANESTANDDFVRQVASKASRKIRMQHDNSQGVWFGLGMSGLIGWSVAVPTVLGVIAGIWIDSRHPSGHSWTLMLLVIGLLLGCATAWRWVSQQDAAMQVDAKEDPDE